MKRGQKKLMKSKKHDLCKEAEIFGGFELQGRGEMKEKLYQFLHL